MFEVQNISASGSNRADLSAPAASAPQDAAPAKVREIESSGGGDRRGQERSDSDRSGTNRAAAEPASPRSPRARLSYSLTDKDSYVEILNPRTGDVIKRFPPKQAEDQLRDFTGGNSGVFLDRVA